MCNGCVRRRVAGGLCSLAVFCAGLGQAAAAEADDGKIPDAVRPTAQLYETLQEKVTQEGLELIPGLLRAGLLLEVEAESCRQGEARSSDLKLSTFELGLEAAPHKLLKGYALLLWEQDDTKTVDLDEAYITLRGGTDVPVALTAGRLYLPFGVFYSHFISNPLTQSLGEMRKTSVLLEGACGILCMRAGVFRRDVAAVDVERLNRYMVACSVRPWAWIEAGGYFVSDLGESDEYAGQINDRLSGAGAPDRAAHDPIGGLGGFAHISHGRWELEAECLGAAQDFNPGILAEAELRPAAWNLEVAYLLRENFKLAARYEGSHDFPEQPRRQYGAAASWGIMEHTTLSLEFLRGEFSAAADRHGAAAQLAVEF